jgi:hypothetical protein
MSPGMSLTTAVILFATAFPSAAPFGPGTPQRPSGSATFGVTAYGARCDGRADDGAAIQRAIDEAVKAGGGTVELPIGACAFSRTLVVGGGKGPAGDGAAFVSIRGQGPAASRLVYTGRGTALSISLNKYFTLAAFSISRDRDDGRGETVGLLLAGPLTNGTQTLGGLIDRVHVSAFHVGIQAGQFGGKASSEMLYRLVSLERNDLGWRNGDYNTLDHQFQMLMMAGNLVGLDVAAGAVWVDGGSASGDGVDFQFEGSSFDNSAIRNYRSEHAGRFVAGRTHSLVVENANAVAPANPDGVAIEWEIDRLLDLRFNQIEGAVRLANPDAPGGLLRMIGNAVGGGADLPYLTGAPTSEQGQLRVDLAGNVSQVRGRADVRYPDHPLATYTRGLFTPDITVTPAGPASPVATLGLNHVKMLAEGSAGAGRNLRMEARFTGEGPTIRVDFVRDVAVTVHKQCDCAAEQSGWRTIGVAAGAMRASDVGKTIVIAGVNGFGGDAVGVVQALADETHAVVLLRPMSQEEAQANGGLGANTIRVDREGVTAAIGEHEPDARYFLALGCDAQETISWSDKSAAGFTLTSSNPASRATCDVTIVR